MLFLKKFLRRLSLNLEYRTSQWVLPSGTVALIENTDTPDFGRYNKEVDKAATIWGNDPVITGARATARWTKFKFDRENG